MLRTDSARRSAASRNVRFSRPGGPPLRAYRRASPSAPPPPAMTSALDDVHRIAHLARIEIDAEASRRGPRQARRDLRPDRRARRRRHHRRRADGARAGRGAAAARGRGHRARPARALPEPWPRPSRTGSTSCPRSSNDAAPMAATGHASLGPARGASTPASVCRSVELAAGGARPHRAGATVRSTPSSRVDADGALAQAQAADAALAKGDAGPLTGIPIAHKDVLMTAGLKTTCGSRMLANFVAPYDALVVEGLQRAGTVLVGKTNMDEFAMGSSNETSLLRPGANPWDRRMRSRRQLGRLGRGGRRAARRRGDRHRHRRLDPPAGRRCPASAA